MVKDGRPMALELTGEGDTEEDEEVASVVEINVKKKRALGQGNKGKGKQRDLGDDLNQQDREPRLQIIVVSSADQFFSASFFQPHHHDEFLDPDPHMLDDFNVDNDVENVDDWVSDKRIVELSQKNTSKVSKAMAIEVSSLWFPRTLTQLYSQRPTWARAAPSSILSAAGSPSIQSVTGSCLTQGVIGCPSPTVSVNWFHNV